MSKIRTDAFGNIESFIFVLAKQSGEKLGVINTVDEESINVNVNLSNASELEYL